MKKIISLLLCAALAFSATVSVNAVNTESEKRGFEYTGETVVLDNNTVLLSASGIDPSTYNYCIKIKGVETQTQYTENLRDVADAPLRIALQPDETYKKSILNGWNGGGSTGTKNYDFSETGGVYKKIRIKLHDFDPDYFNEDGTRTYEMSGSEHTYNFNYEPIGSDGEYYSSCLIFKSGAAITVVAPDENGMVEIYVSAEIGQAVTYHTTYNYKFKQSSGGGGAIEKTVYFLMYGNVDGDYSLDVSDVTALQMGIAGVKEFDDFSAFQSDTNVDGNIDVRDVTYLQFALADGIKLKY